MSPEHDYCQDCLEPYSLLHLPVILSCCQNIICRACAFRKWVHRRRRCWYSECSNYNTKILTLRCAGSFTPPYTDVGHLEEGEDGIVLISIEDLKQEQRLGTTNVEDAEIEGSPAQPFNDSKSTNQSNHSKPKQRKKRVEKETPYLDSEQNRNKKEEPSEKDKIGSEYKEISDTIANDEVDLLSDVKQKEKLCSGTERKSSVNDDPEANQPGSESCTVEHPELASQKNVEEVEEPNNCEGDEDGNFVDDRNILEASQDMSNENAIDEDDISNENVVNEHEASELGLMETKKEADSTSQELSGDVSKEFHSEPVSTNDQSAINEAQAIKQSRDHGETNLDCNTSATKLEISVKEDTTVDVSSASEYFEEDTVTKEESRSIDVKMSKSEESLGRRSRRGYYHQ